MRWWCGVVIGCGDVAGVGCAGAVAGDSDVGVVGGGETGVVLIDGRGPVCVVEVVAAAGAEGGAGGGAGLNAGCAAASVG